MSSTPCVGCGWCCLSDPCEVSHRKYGYMRRCPDLLWDETAQRYICQQMLDPAEGAEARRQLFAGEGCCAPLNAWRHDVRNRDPQAVQKSSAPLFCKPDAATWRYVGMVQAVFCLLPPFL